MIRQIGLRTIIRYTTTTTTTTRSTLPFRPYLHLHQRTQLISSSATLYDQRYTAKNWSNSEPVTYHELKPITKSPSDDILLIDVREPDEVAQGNIPSSVNVPLSSFEKSLSLDEGDFTKIHGFHKPTKGQQIIFYCRSGKRSATALDLAKRAGYRAVRNYEGSWLDWSEKDAKNDD
ncbi:endoplasmic reticulum protein [Meredithblackwellia eburnea MCA 4105]